MPGIETQVITLDSLGLEKCSFMKVDVEGMEMEVLEGARETIARCRPYLFLECAFDAGVRPLWEKLRELNYVAGWVVTMLFDEDNFYHNPESIYGNVCSFNLFCRPAEDSRVVVKGLPEFGVDDKVEGTFTLGKVTKKICLS